MLVVTGSNGFIGKNLIQRFNALGEINLLAVDVPASSEKLLNIDRAIVKDYLGKDEFLLRLQSDSRFASGIKAIFHEGACSSTVEKNETLMMRLNYEYSHDLLECCMRHGIPLQYASSAGVYGNGGKFREEPENESPLTLYARSKQKFDAEFDRILTASPEVGSRIVGLRYFNVYGPGELYKGFMRSTPLVFYEQLRQSDRIKVFGAYGGYEAGQHRRDFIHVDDIVDFKIWAYEHQIGSGIYNLGTGRSRTFQEIAEQVIKYHGQGEIDYIPFPEELKKTYQTFTQADMTSVRKLGYAKEMMPIEIGIPRYLDQLAELPDSLRNGMPFSV